MLKERLKDGNLQWLGYLSSTGMSFLTIAGRNFAFVLLITLLHGKTTSLDRLYSQSLLLTTDPKKFVSLLDY